MAQVNRLLQDCAARCILSSTRYAATATAACPLGCLALELDATAAAGELWQVGCPAVPVDAAVILYTSGTTADPKGVVLTHGNLLAEKTAAFQIVQVDERDVVLGVLPLFHALAQMANLLLPFSLGAHVVFLETLSTRELLAALREERVTVFCCVPQFFYLIHQRVMAEVTRGGAVRRAVFHVLMAANRSTRRLGLNLGPLLFARVQRTLGSAMRYLITGGSRFDPAIGRDLDAMGFTILQAYGLTETSGAATVTRPGEPIETVGRPLPGVEIRIDAPAEGYADGEVLIRGPIVMAGYWQRPDATDRSLRNGWLYTGDLGRLDEQGRLSITGRSKEIIVLQSGKNIYPEEIEAHYAASPFIKELCVVGVNDPDVPSAERLHAVVVPDLDVLRERRIVNVTELIRFELEGLSIALPPHKRVLGFDVSMQPLPRTTTGKLRRHQVRGGQSRAAADAPKADAELPPQLVRVVRLVRELTARPSAGADSNFELDLGLDSMQRVELVAGLEQRLGITIPEESVQAAFTVRDLALAIEAVSEGRVASAQSPAQPWPALLQHVPLTEEQQRALSRRRPLLALVLFVLARVLARGLLRVRVKGVEHLPAAGPFILSPNHQSYVDPFVLVSVLPYRIFRDLFFVGAAEYFETRVTAALAVRLNILPVDPDAKLVPAMQAGAFGLRQGKVLVLFPEGERSIDGTVRKFKKGAGLLSEHVDVPIVPVAIDGMFELWPRNRPLNWRLLMPWRRHTICINIGPPLEPAHQGRLRDEVERLWHDCGSFH